MKHSSRACLFLIIVALAVFPANAQYEITRSVLGGGGATIGGANFRFDGTVGQAAIGLVTGGNWLHEIGFWPSSGMPTAVDEGSTPPLHYELGQNHPNPFNPKTTIRYALPAAGRATLRLFDVTGRELAVLLDAEQEAGWHELDFDGRGLASGVYFYRLEAGRFTDTRKLVLLK